MLYWDFAGNCDVSDLFGEVSSETMQFDEFWLSQQQSDSQADHQRC
jgi:hypothetical protein